MTVEPSLTAPFVTAESVSWDDWPEPYLAAYIRGGAFEVARLATLDLLDRGYLTTDESDGIEPAADPPPRLLLTPILERTLEFFDRRRHRWEIFEAGGLATLLAGSHCAQLERNASEAGWIRPLWKVWAIAAVPLAIAVLVLGAASWVAGAAFLLLATLAIFWAMRRAPIENRGLYVPGNWSLWRWALLWRPTSAGQAVLTSLREPASELAVQMREEGYPAGDPRLIRYAGYMGVDALEGTEHAHYLHLLSPGLDPDAYERRPDYHSLD